MFIILINDLLNDGGYMKTFRFKDETMLDDMMTLLISGGYEPTSIHQHIDDITEYFLVRR